MLPLDAFLSGRKVTQAQRKELERAYNEIKIRKAAAQKRRETDSTACAGNGRRFTASELLFTWLSEPEVWEYSFIADPGNIVHDLIDPETTSGRTVRSSPRRSCVVCLFTERIDSQWPERSMSSPTGRPRFGKENRSCLRDGRITAFTI